MKQIFKYLIFSIFALNCIFPLDEKPEIEAKPDEKPETEPKPDEKPETEAKADENPEVKENDEKNKENENK